MKINLETDIGERIGQRNKAEEDSYKKTSGNLFVCRICYDGDDIETGSPCKCSGTQGYVHLECLKSWVSHKFLDVREAYCEICKEKYIIEAKRSIKKKTIDDPEQKTKYQCKICFLFSTLIILIIITILVFIQIVDFRAKFVRSLIAVLFCFVVILTNVILIGKVYIVNKFEKGICNWTIIFK